MLKNNEFKIYIFLLGTTTLFGTIACFYLQNAAWIIMLSSGIIMMIVSFIFTAWRYRKIKDLSAYLAKVVSGNDPLSLESYTEGEFSILQNELRKIASTLMHQADTLKKDKIFLADSIADISHQLKTPITQISMMTDLLLQGGLSQEKRDEFIGNIQRSTGRIKWLVTTLLKIARLDSGSVSFAKDKVSVEALIENSIQPILSLMEIKEQQFLIKGDNSAEINGDFYWLSEALMNIVKNCVEHTPNGRRITIEYGCNVLNVFIKITDEGDGIDKSDIARIFDRFYKGANSDNDSVGIGLALSKSIIQKQNGSIGVTSEKGKGTEFTIKFYSGSNRK